MGKDDINIENEAYLDNFEKTLPSLFASSDTKKIVRAASDGNLVTYSESFKNYKWKQTRDYNCVLLIFSPVVAASQFVVNGREKQKDNPSEITQKEKDIISMVNRCFGSTKFKLLCEYIGRGDGPKISKLLESFLEYNRLLSYLVYGNETTRNNYLPDRAYYITPWKSNGGYIKTKLLPFIKKAVSSKFASVIGSSMETPSSTSPGEQDLAHKLFDNISNELEKHRSLVGNRKVSLRFCESKDDLTGKAIYRGRTTGFSAFVDKNLLGSGQSLPKNVDVWLDSQELNKHCAPNVSDLAMTEIVDTYCDLIQDAIKYMVNPKKTATPVAPPPPTPTAPAPPHAAKETASAETTPPLTEDPLKLAWRKLLDNLKESVPKRFEEIQAKYSTIKDYLLGVNVLSFANNQPPFLYLESMHFHYVIKPAKSQGTAWNNDTTDSDKVKMFIMLTEKNLKYFIPDEQHISEENIESAKKIIIGSISTLINRFYANLDYINSIKTKAEQEKESKRKPRPIRFTTNPILSEVEIGSKILLTLRNAGVDCSDTKDVMLKSEELKELIEKCKTRKEQLEKAKNQYKGKHILKPNERVEKQKNEEHIKAIDKNIGLLNGKLQSFENAKFIGLGGKPTSLLINCVNLFDNQYDDKVTNAANMNSIGKILPGIAGEAVAEDLKGAFMGHKMLEGMKTKEETQSNQSDDQDWGDDTEKLDETDKLINGLRENHRATDKEIENLLRPLIEEQNCEGYKLGVILEMYRTPTGSKLKPNRLLKIYDITVSLTDLIGDKETTEKIDVAEALLKAKEGGKIQDTEMKPLVQRVISNEHMITKIIKESVANAITDIADIISKQQKRNTPYAVTAYLLIKQTHFDTLNNALAFLTNLEKHYPKPLNDAVLEKSLKLSKILYEIEQKPLSDTTKTLERISKIKQNVKSLDLLARAEIFKLMNAEHITEDEAYKKIHAQTQASDREKENIGKAIGKALVGNRALIAGSDSDISDDDASDYEDWP